MKPNTNLPKKKIVKWCARVFIIYFVIVVAIYFLAGIRSSDGNLDYSAETITPVFQARRLEQHFTTEVERLQRISVKWQFAQPTENTTVVMKLLREDTGEEVALEKFNLKTGTNQNVTTLSFAFSRTGFTGVPLVLVVDCGGWTPVFRASQTGETLVADGIVSDASLNFAVVGKDYVWIGLDYLWIALGGLGFLIVVLLTAIVRFRTTGKGFVVGCFMSASKYKFLISQLVSRDFKSKYKRSFFGVLWSFLNPLLTTLVMYFVFSNVFRGSSDMTNFTAYLIIGVTMFNFFTECCGMCLGSIVGNAHMITKVFVPKYIYPMTRTLSSGINFALALIPMIIIVLLNGIYPTLSWILVFFPIACMLIFCYGFGMLLATSMVFFRDTQFLWGVISMMWMYLTPIFYPANIIPQALSFVQQCNPMFHFITFVRTCILDGVSPDPMSFVACFGSAVLMLFIGGLVFKKSQNSFVLYI